MDEKKSLYRSEYCQTFSEFTYIGNDWQGIIGWVLIHISVALWLFMLLHSFGPPLPPSFKPSAVREEMRQMINMQANPITGISSKWDYEKKDWKNPGFFTPPNPFKDWVWRMMTLTEIVNSAYFCVDISSDCYAIDVVVKNCGSIMSFRVNFNYLKIKY